ncbi:MAG: bifunctional riboflavin kinase/FAD synthetase [Flavobacteriaceae bacterium]|nr:bifunctional riboflavin kinase/FAD synthetase [Flavobacteriaceae bacterium]
MKVISTIENYQATEGCSLTIGTFDGVHIGHREIIDRLVKSAREKNHLAVVLTFFPHPRMVLQKDTSIRLIDTLKEKQQLLSDLGVDVVVIHPFSKEFSRQTADEFTRDILVKAFNIEHLIIGYDHRFGRNREATVDDLINAGETYGFTVEKIEAQEIASVNVSSTKIRTALEKGKMKIATDYLNRPFRLSGKVIEGEKIGRTIGFPTANLQIEEEYKLMPCDGVYFIQSQLENTLVYGMMNVGFRPTLEGEKRSFEVHFFDFKQDLYGALLHIDLLELIRKEKKFDSLEMLKAQLEEDQAKCRQLIPAK